MRPVDKIAKRLISLLEAIDIVWRLTDERSEVDDSRDQRSDCRYGRVCFKFSGIHCDLNTPLDPFFVPCGYIAERGDHRGCYDIHIQSETSDQAPDAPFVLAVIELISLKIERVGSVEFFAQRRLRVCPDPSIGPQDFFCGGLEYFFGKSGLASEMIVNIRPCRAELFRQIGKTYASVPDQGKQAGRQRFDFISHRIR